MYISVPAATLLAAVAVHDDVPFAEVQLMIELPWVGVPVLPGVVVAEKTVKVAFAFISG
jgi:hypothetical protein